MSLSMASLASSILRNFFPFSSSLICPPIGIIDGSMLTTVGELLFFPLITKLPEAIKAGRSIKLRKGDFSAEVTGKDDDRDLSVNC